MDDEQPMVKIVVIGNSGTGKTNLSTRYILNEFSESRKATVGVQFLHKTMTVHSKKLKVAIWDTAGQEKYKGLSKVYYKGASGVMIVYDVTDPQSYLDVESWMRLVNQNLNISDIVMMVVGNKVDLEEERKVPTQRPIREYKEKFDIDCWEVSAKTGFHVKEVMNQMVEKIYQMMMNPHETVVYPAGSEVGADSFVDPMSFIQANRNSQNRISKNIPHVVVQQTEFIPPKTKKNIKLKAQRISKKEQQRKRVCC